MINFPQKASPMMGRRAVFLDYAQVMAGAIAEIFGEIVDLEFFV